MQLKGLPVFNFFKQLRITAIACFCAFTGLAIYPQASFCQISDPHKIDSLQKILQNPALPADSNKVETLCQLSLAYTPVNYNTAFSMAQAALTLAEKLKWQRGIGIAWHATGKSYWAKSDYLNALAYFQKALELLTRAGDTYNSVIVLKSIGSANFAASHFDEALASFQKGLQLAESSTDKAARQLINGQFGLATSIATAWSAKGNHAKALEYCTKAITANLQNNNKPEAARILPIRASYKSMLNDYTGAVADVLQGLAISKSVNDHVGQGGCYEVLGWFKTAHREYKSAVECFKNAITEYGYVNEVGHIARNYASLSEVYLYIGDLGADSIRLYVANRDEAIAKAAQNLEKAIEIGSSVNSMSDLQWYEGKLADIYVLQGNNKKALNALKRYSAYKDSLSGKTIQRKYTEQLLQYEYNKQKDSLNYINSLQQTQLNSLQQEKELAGLRQHQLLLYSITAFTVIGLLASLFIFRTRLQRLKLKTELSKEKADTQLKEAEFNSRMTDISFLALRSQMNPHFIFNCLNSIKLYTEQNNSEAASEYLTKFSKLIRRMLDSARSDNITLASEIELITLYLEMEAMRFKEKLQYCITADADTDADFIEIPPLLIQPYVENAVWHGLMHKEEGGTININIGVQNGQLLVITIDDDGIGRIKAAELKSKTAVQHKSFGTRLTAERIALINEKYKTSAQIIIDDLYDVNNNACGTRVTIKLPIR